uniref:Uncharacterized protein n=1 Tax=viral metagenome TaxID=1070528 RepID=A0A6M3KWU6_9ZZZZ
MKTGVLETEIVVPIRIFYTAYSELYPDGRPVYSFGTDESITVSGIQWDDIWKLIDAEKPRLMAEIREDLK